MKIVFIPCTKKKLSVSAEVQHIYNSDLFKKMLRYAKSLKPDRIFVLSAKYGLLELNDVINPYELTLNKMPESYRKEWAIAVIEKLNSKGIKKDDYAIFLAGNNYRKHLTSYFDNYDAPLKHLGIGKQLQYLKRQIIVNETS